MSAVDTDSLYLRWSNKRSIFILFVGDFREKKSVAENEEKEKKQDKIEIFNKFLFCSDYFTNFKFLVNKFICLYTVN